jgi:succinyl-diaminopimelate desuccinylase
VERVVELTRELVACETVNPPGGESRAADLLAPRLEAAGFAVERHPLAAGRDSLIARRTGIDPHAPALCLTGHLDTVPLGETPWTVDPFGGEIADGRVHGRGASDMKGGVAAIVTACERLAALDPGECGLEVVLCAGEETGCDGAASLVDALGRVGAVLVAEPTSNRPLAAHKGALWMRGLAHGRSAHGSMPHLGRNAIYAMARAVARLEAWRFEAPEHPLLGAPTLSVGTIAGGTNVNSVPDECTIGIDVRSVPGLEHDALLEALGQHLGNEIELRRVVDLPPVATDPDHPWVHEVCAAVSSVTGRSDEPAGIAYFTDAAVLTPAYRGPPTVICGPGEPDQAHRTDEWCSIEALGAAEQIVFEIARRWLRSPRADADRA